MSSKKRWKTWDRDPEPVFTDYTYLAYDDKKIHTFPVLDYRLTGFLNELDVVIPADVSKVVEAYERFERDACLIQRLKREKIKLLEASAEKKIIELGEKIARELKSCNGE